MFGSDMYRSLACLAVCCAAANRCPYPGKLRDLMVNYRVRLTDLETRLNRQPILEVDAKDAWEAAKALDAGVLNMMLSEGTGGEIGPAAYDAKCMLGHGSVHKR